MRRRLRSGPGFLLPHPLRRRAGTAPALVVLLPLVTVGGLALGLGLRCGPEGLAVATYGLALTAVAAVAALRGLWGERG